MDGTGKGLARDLPDFQLEKYVADHAYAVRHHLSASDAQTLSVAELLEMAGPGAEAAFLSRGLGYTAVRGGEGLRAAIAATYTRQSAETVMAFAGAGEAIFAVLNVLLSPGDHAVAVTPNYQSHEALPWALGAVTGVPLDPAQGWALDLQAVAEAVRPETRAIVINYPHNPTGALLSEAALAELVALCRRQGLYLVNDEVFHGLGPSAAAHVPAVADVYERGVSINVLSKAYGLPGLRIGWVATPDQGLLSELEAFKHYLSVCPAGPSEWLGEIALRQRDRILARNCGIIDENIALWSAFFARHPTRFAKAVPVGGSIAYPKYLGPGSVEEFAQRLLHAHGIFVVPASTFPSQSCATPEGHFRIGFARRGLAEGLAALDAALAEMPTPA